MNPHANNPLHSAEGMQETSHPARIDPLPRLLPEVLGEPGAGHRLSVAQANRDSARARPKDVDTAILLVRNSRPL